MPPPTAVKAIKNMNRFWPNDSQNALDHIDDMLDTSSMKTQANYLYLERLMRSQNMARFYAMSIEPTIFGDYSLFRRWGRIGSRGYERQQLFSKEIEAIAALERISARKREKGYRPLADPRNELWNQTKTTQDLFSLSASTPPRAV